MGWTHQSARTSQTWSGAGKSWIWIVYSLCHWFQVYHCFLYNPLTVSNMSGIDQTWRVSMRVITRYVLACPFSLSIYLFFLLSIVHHLYLIIHSLSHPQFSISIYPHFIYLHSIFLSTLLRYSVLSLWLIPDCSDQPDHYHTPHLYKYSSYKLL